MSKGNIFPQIDLYAGFWQLGVNKEDIQKTVFVSSLGLVEFVTVPFGLKNAPSIFQRALEEILKDVLEICCKVYIKNIIIYSENKKEHADHV